LDDLLDARPYIWIYRKEALYRVIYQSFTPKMMARTPMWLKKRIAATLGWRLVPVLKADDWLRGLFTKQGDEPTPIAISMFESCAAGWSARPFFSPRWLWHQAKHIWAGGKKPQPETRSALYDTITSPPPLKAPGMLPEEAESMDTGMNRKRLFR
jgi:hypothetical protein